MSSSILDYLSGESYKRKRIENAINGISTEVDHTQNVARALESRQAMQILSDKINATTTTENNDSQIMRRNMERVRREGAGL